MSIFEEQYQQSGLASQRRYPNEALLGFLASHYFPLPLEQRSKVKILELGCGSGANLWMLAREGFSTWGLDFAPTGLSYCQRVLELWGEEANLTLGDMTHLPYASESFDAIVDVVSMQHLDREQHERALAEVSRVLKPGGRFFSYHLGAGSSAFSAPSAKKLDEVTLADIPAGYPLAGNGQSCFLSGEQYLELVSAAGLGSISIERQWRTYTSLQSYVEYILLSAQK